MERFIVGGFILSLIFNALWIVALISSDLKPILKAFWSLVLIIICTIIFTVILKETDREWNNGYCINCGTPYQAISHSRGSTRYECPKCHFAMSR